MYNCTLKQFPLPCEQACLRVERLADCGSSLHISHSNRIIPRSRDDVAPIRRVNNAQHSVSVPFNRLADRRSGIRLQYSNGVVIEPRDDMQPIGRLTNGQHPVVMPLERVADCISSLCIPYSNSSCHRAQLTDHTASACPSRGLPTADPVSASHIRIVQSEDPLRM